MPVPGPIRTSCESPPDLTAVSCSRGLCVSNIDDFRSLLSAMTVQLRARAIARPRSRVGVSSSFRACVAWRDSGGSFVCS